MENKINLASAVYFLTWCLLTAGQIPSWNTPTVNGRALAISLTRVAAVGAVSPVTALVAEMALTSLGWYQVQTLVHPPFRTLRGDTQPCTKSKVSQGGTWETQTPLFWVGRACPPNLSNTCCPSRPVLHPLALSHSPAQKGDSSGPYSLSYTGTFLAVLSSCPCCYDRVLLPRDKPKQRDPTCLCPCPTGRSAHFPGSGQIASFPHLQICLQPSIASTASGAGRHQCPCPRGPHWSG